ncbi:MAG: FdtA/QdtA family cupin domain-containing protein [Bacteroidia bacterium]|nr:FdtA/QdtA family cupin domain-containing protein [Bacteroidia bacterium]NNF32280.1 WxcM-like domain-containing protein [Flavobacteriaceae bacterium]MBT8276922.1 FdtA/QdtA family cupin domain-containing protein [Bacteroidia bacterium]NNJ83297.1 WxcM-like domain-containing protein [Flavobacteriaceae bacterium]NNK53761.1 WxcM-like domain-containing protein [Flavobacteriaceae bacterium]
MSYVDIDTISLLEIPKISDPDGRGNLSVIEKNVLPFIIKRVYYLYDVPSDSSRGGHAHKELKQFIIALSGSFDVVLDNGRTRRTFTLNRPNKGLLIPSGVWRELENFSAGAVCLSLVSEHYNEDDYIRDYDDFVSSK